MNDTTDSTQPIPAKQQFVNKVLQALGTEYWADINVGVATSVYADISRQDTGAFKFSISVYDLDGKTKINAKTRFDAGDLSDKVVKKVVKKIQGEFDVQAKIQSIRTAYVREREEAAVRLNTELSGAVVPPGLTVDTIGGNTPGVSGQYYLGVAQHGSVLSGKPITAAQARELFEAINRIFKNEDRYVVVRKSNDKVVAVEGTVPGWFHELTPGEVQSQVVKFPHVKLYTTREEAEKTVFLNYGTEVAKYADIATI